MAVLGVATHHRLVGLVALALTIETLAASSCGQATVRLLEPQAVMLLPQGNDPRVIHVTVNWTEPGWCLGQFRVRDVVEAGAEVRLGSVVDTEDPNANCAGMGSSGATAWAELTLKQPLGGRRVVRASDGAILPILSPSG